jgi:hypothetical protein
MEGKRVLVIGGGTSGNVMTVLLRRAGIDVDLVEAKEDWNVRGSGITLQGNALRVLREIGVRDEVREHGFGSREALPARGRGDGRALCTGARPAAGARPGPLQHPEQAVRALEHALDQGLLGVEISSHAPGRELSDPAYEPLWTRAEETGAILFLHPFGHPRRAPRPVVPVQHRRPAHRERRRALTPDLLRGAGPAPGAEADRRARGRLPAHPHRPLRPRLVGPLRRGRGLRPPAQQLPQAPVPRLPRPRPACPAGAYRRGRRGPCAARLRFPLRHGQEDPVGALRAVRLPDDDFHAVRGGNATTLLRLT